MKQPSCSRSFSCSVYGLTVDSALPFEPPAGATQAASGSEADLSIHLGALERLEGASHRGPVPYRASRREVSLCWPGLARTRIRDGCRIVIDPEPRADTGRLSRVIWHQTLGVALQQRGLLTLHGSSVRVAEKGVIFLGASGAGKSTLAAAMHFRYGCDLIADELSVVRPGVSGFELLPGPSQVDLTPEALAGLGLASTGSGQAPGKRAFPSGFASIAPVSLAKIYLLESERDSTPPCSSSQEAFLRLLRHTYCGPLLAEMEMAEEHFELCSDLASATPMETLNVPAGFDHIDELTRFVYGDLG